MTTETKPRWATYEVAENNTGINRRTLQAYVAGKLIRSSLVVKPGKGRGVRMIELNSLDEFIEKGEGLKAELEMNTKREAAQGASH